MARLLQDQFTKNKGEVTPEVSILVYDNIYRYYPAFDIAHDLLIPALYVLTAYGNRHFPDANLNKMVKANASLVPLSPFEQPFLVFEDQPTNVRLKDDRDRAELLKLVANFYLGLVGMEGSITNANFGFANPTPTFEEICVADFLFTRAQHSFRRSAEEWLEAQKKLQQIPDPAEGTQADELARFIQEAGQIRDSFKPYLLVARYEWKSFLKVGTGTVLEQIIAEAAVYDYDKQLRTSQIDFRKKLA